MTGARAAETFDAVVLGAGEAGALVAERAVAAGRRVALVYRAPYGSTCLNTGCVPSKFLIRRARVAHVARTAGRFHVRVGEPQVDLAGIVREKDALVRGHRAEAERGAATAERLTLVEGAARFVSAREVVAAGRTLRAERIFIATGLRPLIPRIDGLDRVRVLTNESLMDLMELPEHLVVAGGGYIACELGQAFRRYGSRVTIVQSRDHLLPREEPDVSAVLERAVAAEGIDLVLGHRVVRVEPVRAGVRVVARAPDGGERAVGGSHLLIAAGRRPNTDGLALDTAGVATDDQGFVRVDRTLATTVPGIWAIGEVNGAQPFTRVCQEEANRRRPRSPMRTPSRGRASPSTAAPWATPSSPTRRSAASASPSATRASAATTSPRGPSPSARSPRPNSSARRPG